MKRCSKCGVEKGESHFSKHKNASGGLRPQCKDCIKIASAIYYVKNKKEINIRNKQYWEENKDLLNDWQKQYYEEHKDEKTEYLIENREILALKRRDRENNRLKTDAAFKLRKNVASVIRKFLKDSGNSKNGSCVNKLGYSFQELREHLEQLFESWMSWDNWGTYDPKIWNDNDVSTWTWQLDHIIPHSTFNYTSMNDEEFKKCWALENLRPLPSKQNLLEGITRTRHGK